MGKTESVTLKVAGMSCAHCEKRVTEALRKLDGVKDAKASAKDGEVRIQYDPNIVDIGRLRAAIEQSGYTPE